MELLGKVKLLIIGAIIFLGGNVVGFSQGIKASVIIEKQKPVEQPIHNSCDDVFLLRPSLHDLFFRFPPKENKLENKNDIAL